MSRSSVARVYDLAVGFAKAFKGKPNKASSGERRFAGWTGPVNGAVAGGQGSSQVWQIQQYSNLCYIAVNFIATNFAHCKPAVVKVLGYGEKRQHDYLTTKAFKFGTALPPARRFVNSLITKSSAGARPQEEEYEFLPDSPLAKLLADPNEPDIGLTLWYLGDLFYELTGDCYIYKHRNGAGQVVELWIIPTHWVRPISTGTNHLIDYYEVWPFTARSVGSPNPDAMRIDLEDMIRIKKPSPFHPIASYSPVQASAAEIDTYGQITAARYLALQNGMSNGGALTAKAGSPEMDDDTIARYEARMQGHYGGVFNSGRVMLLPVGYEFQYPPDGRELDFRETQIQLREQVMMTFDLDMSYFQSKESTDNNAIELRRKLYARVIRPRQELWSGVLTERLARDDFGDDLRIIYPYTPERTREEERLDCDTASNFKPASMSINEFRTGFLGLEPREEPECDLVMIDPSLVPMDAASERWDAETEVILNPPQKPIEPTNEEDTKLENEPVAKSAKAPVIMFKTLE